MEDRPPLSQWLPWWWALALIWGSSFFLIKISLESFAPLQVTFGRVLFGLLAVLAVLLARRRRLPRQAVVWMHTSVVALMLNVLPFTLFAWAEQRVSSVLAGLFNAATPLFTALFALAIVPTERLSRPRVVGLFVGFLGVMIVMGVWRGVSGDLAGSLACLGATACYGVGVPWTRRFLSGRPEGAESLMAAQLICSVAMLTALCGAFTSVPDVSGRSLVAVALLGAVATGLAFLWNFRVIAVAGSVVSASVTYATPVVSTLLGIVLLNEPVSWNQPLGAAVVVLGASLVQGILGSPRSASRARAG